MNEFEEIWNEAREKAGLSFSHPGTLSWELALYRELKERIEPLIQQALLVVPECVDKDIREFKRRYNSDNTIIFNLSRYSQESKDWVEKSYENTQCFYLAVSIGKYEVEKPQLFKLIFPNSTAVLQKNGELNSFADTVYKRYLIGNAMTEQEIKSIDERYWQFAVPVEDGE